MNPKKTILIAIENIPDATEKAWVDALFERAPQWKQPWRITACAKDADFVLVGCEQPSDLLRWHGAAPLSRDRLIAYSALAFPEAARWHLPRRAGQPPAALRFVMMMQEINAFWASRQAQEPAPLPQKAAPRNALTHNWRDKAKILFVGSVGAGKTTAVAAISDDGRFISTEAKPTDSVRQIKSTTTVAMDYGTTHLPDGTRLEIYGSPGQRRFAFMSELLIKQALGIIVLINNAADDPVADLGYYLEFHKFFLAKNPGVIGITHQDQSARPPLEDYAAIVAARGGNWPVLACDTRDHGQVMALVTTLVTKAIEQ